MLRAEFVEAVVAAVRAMDALYGNKPPSKDDEWRTIIYEGKGRCVSFGAAGITVTWASWDETSDCSPPAIHTVFPKGLGYAGESSDGGWKEAADIADEIAARIESEEPHADHPDYNARGEFTGGAK